MSQHKTTRSVFESILQATQVDRVLRQRAQEVTREHGGITNTEWLLLSIIGKGPKKGLTMSALGATLGVSRPQITALLENLLVKRFIRQKKSSHDGRSRTATITQRGADTLKRIDEVMEQSFADLMKSIPGTHLQIYRQVQDEIIRKS